MKKSGFKLYTASVIVLAVLSLAALVLSLCHIKDAAVFDGALCGILLGVTALLCAVCLCLENANGNFFYKLGFYLLHGGMVVLLAGFLLSRFLCAAWTVAIPVGDDSYRYVVDEATGAESDLGFYLGVSDTVTEYYRDEDGKETANPKYYEATVEVTDAQSLRAETKALTVNHPLRLQGTKNYKVYLMSLYTDEMTGGDMAVLYLKADPAEYTILAGIVLLISGSVCMCLLGDIRKKGGERK